MTTTKNIKLQRGIDKLATDIFAHAKRRGTDLKEKVDALKAVTSWYAVKNKVDPDTGEGAGINDFRSRLNSEDSPSGKGGGKPAPEPEQPEGNELFDKFISRIPRDNSGIGGDRIDPVRAHSFAAGSSGELYSGDYDASDADNLVNTD